MIKAAVVIVIILSVFCIGACSNRQSAANNNKMAQSTAAAESSSSAAGVSETTGPEGYDYNIEEDKKTFDAGHIDIVVGDNFFATQINDWYANFDDYDGKTVEIEGYYIDSYPYKFVGRFGPSCPYCSVGYVAFEIYTDEDPADFISGTDWIKVQGILRKGKDSSGEFYYLEAISLVKGPVGKDTVIN